MSNAAAMFAIGIAMAAVMMVMMMMMMMMILPCFSTPSSLPLPHLHNSLLMYTEMAFVDSDNNLVVAYHLRPKSAAA